MLEFLSHYWWLLLIAIILAAFFFLSRWAKKVQTEAKGNAETSSAFSEIQIGSKVILDSGIHGIIKKINEKTFIIEIAPNVQIECEKYGVIFVR